MNFYLCSFTRRLLYNVKKKKKKCEQFGLSGIQIQRNRTMNLIITFESHILSILVVTLSLLQSCCFPTKMTCQPEISPGEDVSQWKSDVAVHLDLTHTSERLLEPVCCPRSTIQDTRDWTDAYVMLCEFTASVSPLSLSYLVWGFVSTGLDHHQLTQYPLVYSSRAGHCFCNGSNLPKVCPLPQTLVLQPTQRNSLDLEVTWFWEAGSSHCPKSSPSGSHSELTLWTYESWLSWQSSARSGRSPPLHTHCLAFCPHHPRSLLPCPLGPTAGPLH